MKRFLCSLVLLLILLVSCEKDRVEQKLCIPLFQDAVWEKEKFHDETMIQFPPDFIGGRIDFEGPSFMKYRLSSETIFHYDFCGGLTCDDYGKRLDNIDTTFIKVLPFNFSLDTIALTKRLEFCDDLVTWGIYFYNDSTYSVGKLYWKTDYGYKDALTITYKQAQQEEVERILATIHK